MCWQTFSKKYTIKKIAKEDIKVFKIITTDNTPYYQSGITYEVDKVCPNVTINVIEFAYGTEFRINKGYHSYSKKKCYLDDEVFSLLSGGKGQWIRKKADNTTLTYYTYDKYPNYKKENFIIPKGTTYYENEWGEIVSETIMMTQN